MYFIKLRCAGRCIELAEHAQAELFSRYSLLPSPFNPLCALPRSRQPPALRSVQCRPAETLTIRTRASNSAADALAAERIASSVTRSSQRSAHWNLITSRGSPRHAEAARAEECQGGRFQPRASCRLVTSGSSFWVQATRWQPTWPGILTLARSLALSPSGRGPPPRAPVCPGSAFFCISLSHP